MTEEPNHKAKKTRHEMEDLRRTRSTESLGRTRSTESLGGEEGRKHKGKNVSNNNQRRMERTHCARTAKCAEQGGSSDHKPLNVKLIRFSTAKNRTRGQDQEEEKNAEAEDKEDGEKEQEDEDDEVKAATCSWEPALR